MSRIAIVSDTNSGISPSDTLENNIFLVPMPVIINEETFFENETIFPDEFYKQLNGGASVSTSQPSPGDLIELWDKLLEQYDQLVCIPMSSGLSGSYASALALSSDEPYAGKVFVADNRRISVTLRQSVLEAAYFAGQGYSAEEIVSYLERDGLNSNIYLAVNTLEHLKKSGRVTAAGAAIGTVLDIKPVLQIQGGKLDAYKKVRGMHAAIRTIIDALQHDIDTRYKNQRVIIRAAWTGDEETGEKWRQRLQTAFPDMDIEKDPLSLSIACHTGDGALGVGIMKNIF